MKKKPPIKARPSKRAKRDVSPFDKYLGAEFTERLVQHVKKAKAAALKSKE